MKNSGIIFLALMAIFTLNSCGEGNKKVEAEEGVTMPMQNDTRLGNDDGRVEEDVDLDDGEETGDAAFENEEIAAVYEQYSEIKSALVNSDATGAKEAAEALVEALQVANEEEKILEVAKKIAASEELNVQKTAFAKLSAEVETLVSGALTSGEIYKQYCPMAFSGEGGYWLSSSKEVRNPYFGDKMLTCGRVSETIQ